ncbi:hypothetical protein AVEN_242097-1, partial [Araneus ventricosus]
MKISFRYFFCEGRENTGMQVFLLIAKDSTVHSSKSVETNTPTHDQRGKKGNSRRVPKEYQF